MAILDLQGLTTPTSVKNGRGGKSGASKNCNNGGGSGLSLLLC